MSQTTSNNYNKLLKANILTANQLLLKIETEAPQKEESHSIVSHCSNVLIIIMMMML